MRKKSTSGVLASLSSSTYRSVRLAVSLAAALFAERCVLARRGWGGETPGHFAHPRWEFGGGMRSRWIATAGGMVMTVWLTGCTAQTQPHELFQLQAESQRNRAMQTRFFETKDEMELLSASAAVLQDLGFQVEESVREVGFLRAAKERSAREYGQDLTRFAIFLLSTGLIFVQQPPIVIPVDLHQKVAATLVTRPLNAEATRQEVRVFFYRVVWKGDGSAGRQPIAPGEQRMEMLRDPVLYQTFFAKLSKAVFLEPFTL